MNTHLGTHLGSHLGSHTPPACTSARRSALRRLLGAGLGLGAAATLGGCGFRLRQPVSLAYKRIALLGFKPNSAMAEALRASLPSGVSVVDAPKDAEVVITALEDKSYRVVAGSTASGQVRELSLRVVLKYRLSTPSGQTLVSDTTLEQSRSLSYSETYALAKETEEVMLVHEMRSDIAGQLLRMLATTGRQAL